MPINLRPSTGNTNAINNSIDFQGPPGLVLTSDGTTVKLQSHDILLLNSNNDFIYRVDSDNNDTISQFRWRSNASNTDLMTLSQTGNLSVTGAVSAAGGSFSADISGTTPSGLGTAGAAGKFVPLNGSGFLPSAVLPPSTTLTSDQVAAIGGTSGTPSASNKFVTQLDTDRLINTNLKDALAGTAGSPSTSNRFVTQSDNRIVALTTDALAALAGTSGTPSASNKFVTSNDSRMITAGLAGVGATTSARIAYGTATVTNSSVTVNFGFAFGSPPVVVITPTFYEQHSHSISPSGSSYSVTADTGFRLTSVGVGSFSATFTNSFFNGVSGTIHWIAIGAP